MISVAAMPAAQGGQSDQGRQEGSPTCVFAVSGDHLKSHVAF